jgi:phosphoglycolate phosphatase
MPLRRPTRVIFDMDGTTVEHINPRILNWLEKLDDFAFLLKSYFSSATHQPLPVRKKPPRLLVHRAIHHLRRKEVDQIVQPSQGIYEVLNLLQQHHIPMGLASNGLGKGYGHDILEKFDLEKYFEVTIFREDITRAKPDPEGILLTLSKMKTPVTAQDHIWYIGDRHKDIRAALAADHKLPCRIVPLAFGINAAVAVLEHGLSAEHIIMSYADLRHRLENIFLRSPNISITP